MDQVVTRLKEIVKTANHQINDPGLNFNFGVISDKLFFMLQYFYKMYSSTSEPEESLEQPTDSYASSSYDKEESTEYVTIESDRQQDSININDDALQEDLSKSDQTFTEESTELATIGSNEHRDPDNIISQEHSSQPVQNIVTRSSAEYATIGSGGQPDSNNESKFGDVNW
ncbi:14232_t:CDS:2 [Funneliformis mosseae]|uniref:14232_t:CDS:1 n=1 Tax=Funneliformis mosseae TaxID=27381 RepID=A0A9N9HBA7_FUNMO|nr:14232_t:CDS:2 [Funneliformis mosseae]